MADQLDVYRRQGFGQSSGIGERPALVVVDFVVGFADPAMFGGGNIAPAIAATRVLLGEARRRGWPVAFTRVVYAEDGSDAGVMARKVPPLLKLTEDAPASRIVPELAPLPGELVVRKQAPSAFFGTGFAAWLTMRKADTLIITGCTTSGCVRATVLDSVSYNFSTIVPRDCVGDRSIPQHDANLIDIAQKYADVVTSAELIERVAPPATGRTAHR